MGNSLFSFFQVVERLFSLLSDCMWEAPIAQAKHSIQVKERVQELKLQVCSSTPEEGPLREGRAFIISWKVGKSRF